MGVRVTRSTVHVGQSVAQHTGLADVTALTLSGFSRNFVGRCEVLGVVAIEQLDGFGSYIAGQHGAAVETLFVGFSKAAGRTPIADRSMTQRVAGDTLGLVGELSVTFVIHGGQGGRRIPAE